MRTSRRYLRGAAGALALLLGGCAGWPSSDASLYEELSASDVNLAARTLEAALENSMDGATRRWTNQTTGSGGAITPTSTYLAEDGRFCRDYREELTVGARSGRFWHAACRDENAGWVWL